MKRQRHERLEPMAKKKANDDTTGELSPNETNKSGRTIELANVGPVESLTIKIPDDGGVVVLRGRNGSGKSTTLEALQSVATGKGALSVRDGELRGEVKAFGVTVTVAQSTRRRGEADVVTLEGPGDVSTLVDPGLQSDDAADVRRIRALLSLVGATCDATAFWRLLDGREGFEKIVRAKSIEGDDPVTMADRIKRDIEAAARAEEGEGETAQRKASELLAQNDGIDLEVEHDADTLAKALEDATAFVGRQRAKAEAFDNACGAREEAAAKLQELRANAPDLEALTREEAAASHATGVANVALVDLRNELTELQKRIATAEQTHAKALAEHKAAADRLKNAKASADAIAAAAKAVEEALPDAVTIVEVEAALADQRKARDAMERGVIVRQALKRTQDAEAALAKAGAHNRKAESLRNAAKGVDDVLSELVGRACSRLRVEAGRLILTTGRGKTYFADLSHGERWKLALEVAIDAVGRGGVLVCPQEAYEALDPSNRRAIAAQLAGSGVVLFTALASDDPTVVAETVGA